MLFYKATCLFLTEVLRTRLKCCQSLVRSLRWRHRHLFTLPVSISKLSDSWQLLFAAYGHPSRTTAKVCDILVSTFGRKPGRRRSNVWLARTLLVLLVCADMFVCAKISVAPQVVRVSLCFGRTDKYMRR